MISSTFCRESTSLNMPSWWLKSAQIWTLWGSPCSSFALRWTGSEVALTKEATCLLGSPRKSTSGLWRPTCALFSAFPFLALWYSLRRLVRRSPWFLSISARRGLWRPWERLWKCGKRSGNIARPSSCSMLHAPILRSNTCLSSSSSQRAQRRREASLPTLHIRRSQTQALCEVRPSAGGGIQRLQRGSQSDDGSSVDWKLASCSSNWQRSWGLGHLRPSRTSVPHLRQLQFSWDSYKASKSCSDGSSIDSSNMS